MRIAIDALGGDHAPEAPVVGALQALEAYPDVGVVLVGEPEGIRAALAKHGAAPSDRISIHDAPETPGCEDPVKAIRRSAKVSARACADLLHQGDVQGVVTMGTTGAAVAAATLYCRRLPGVKKALHLHQYAVMAMHYATASLGIEKPRIAILSIGEEETKGNRLVAETWELFRANPLPNFIGNIEPHAVFEGGADVIVCDGFTGNIILKTAEGMASFIMKGVPAALKEAGIEKDPRSMLASLMTALDYAQYGGAPLLGVEGAYVIGHGRSGPEAFKNGVRVIRAYIEGRVGDRIVEQLASTGAQASGDEATA